MFISYCKLDIMGTLGMSGNEHQKWWYQLAWNFNVYLHAKNQIYPVPLPWNVAKILQTCYFGYLGDVWPPPQKPIVSTSKGCHPYSSCTLIRKRPIRSLTHLSRHTYIGETVNWKKTKTNKKFENLHYQYQGRILHSYTKVLYERILLNITKSVFYKV